MPLEHSAQGRAHAEPPAGSELVSCLVYDPRPLWPLSVPPFPGACHWVSLSASAPSVPRWNPARSPPPAVVSWRQQNAAESEI